MKTKNILLTAFAIFALAMLSTSAVLAQTQTKAEAKVQEKVEAQVQTKAEAKTQAQTKTMTTAGICDGIGQNFVDLNGDGINDNAPDHDGDGIPNSLDEDWVKQARDGDGYQMRQNAQGDQSVLTRHRMRTKTQQLSRLQSFNGSTFRNRFNAAGSMNGTGAGVCDGTGGGGAGTGVCDGSSPHGTRNGGGK